jgi:putative restriction endonuclease
MRLLVAITASDWFNHLSELRPDEVNFWQPSGSGSFCALSPGEPLLFKLHAPNDFVVGGGFFSHYTIVPASFSWSAFGQMNGAATESEMRRRIENTGESDPGWLRTCMWACNTVCPAEGPLESPSPGPSA